MNYLIGILALLFALYSASIHASENKIIHKDTKNKNENQQDYLGLELENYSYPYSVSYFNFESQLQKLKMGYMDVNYTPAKPQKTVVLFHGKNFNGAYWETTIQALVEQGHRVIVPDQIGFGKSSKPEHYQFSFQQLADNTHKLLSTLEVKRASILGHSMGGMLATRFALMYPEITEKLILVNPIGLEDYKKKAPYKTVEWWYNNELKKTREGIKQYQKANYYDGNWKSEYDPWVNILAGWIPNPNYHIIAWNAALTYDMIFTQPVVYEFSNLKMPTLLIIGTRDRTALGKPLVSDQVRKTMGLYEVLGKKTKKAIPNATLVELPEIGHLPHIEAFKKFITPLIEFIE